MPKLDRHIADIRGPHEHAAYDGRADEAEVRAKRLDVIAKAAYNNLRAYSNCCRSTLWALLTHLPIEGEDALKASSTLAGGIAGSGETCGAVLGALMAIGCAVGPEDPTERGTDARRLASSFVERFVDRFGTTRCYGLQEATIGWRCDDPGLVEKWIAAGGPVACAGICADAAQIAAELILDANEFAA